MTTPTRWDEPTAKALAHLVAKLRPAWDTPGILAALHVAYGRHHDLAIVAHIAIDAAVDQTATTPGVIVHRDRTATALPTSTPRPTDAARICRRCGRTHVTQLDHDCPLPASPHTAQRALDDARQALHDARQEPA